MRAERRKPGGGQAVAGRDAGLEEHLVGAGVRPLVLAADQIGRERERARGLRLVEAEQPAAGGGGGKRAGEAGRAEGSGEFRRHKRAADAAANLISDDRRGSEAASVDAPLLAPSASRGGRTTMPRWLTLPVCMSSRTRPWPATLLAKTASAAGALMVVPMIEQGPAPAVAKRLRLTGPWQRMRLKSAGEEVEEADP